MPRIQFDNYPLATVACFDATQGDLPRRSLDIEKNNRFLQRLAQSGSALLIGASTGQGHLRTAKELGDWFASTSSVDLGDSIKMALLRPEDGESEHRRQASILVDSGFDVAFVRPGNDIAIDASDEQVADNMTSAVQAAADVGLAVGVYSIPDVSGIPLRPDAVALLRGRFDDALVAIKVTESNFESSTLKFIEDPRLDGLRIVQGWDPFMAQALQMAPDRCGVTSGPMSFALFQYLHILDAAKRSDWDEVRTSQQPVTSLFESMQDDPGKFADLQRAKWIMGLGHPLTGEVTDEQIERVFTALDGIERKEDKIRLAKSLNLLEDGPFASRLESYC